PPAMLRDEDTEADFQRFLRRVDEVANLLQGLNSSDSAVKEEAIAETEKRLREEGASREEEEEGRTTVNRTVINTSVRAFPSEIKAGHTSGAFLAALEKDAKERAQRRRRNEQLANALKEQGNEAFREGDFPLAIQRYTEGLEKLRDKQELYTNRAQAYLKLHEYEKAISDCEWALKCNKNCLKAYFLMGKAHLALQHFRECRQCYEKMLQIDPQKENLFKACVNEASLEERRLRDEERAAREAQNGAAAAACIQELLQRISSPGQDILCCTAGIRLLAGAVNNCTGQTLFRTNNGFSILGKEPVRGAFCAERKGPAEVELCVSLLLLWQAACAGNEVNQHLLLAQPEVRAQLPELLSCGAHEIQREALALISLCSENESGRRLLAQQGLTSRLQMLREPIKSTDEEADSATSIPSDLTVADRFQTQSQVPLSGASFAELMGRFGRVQQAGTAPLGTAGSPCAGAEELARLAGSRECWQACLDECWAGSSPESRQRVLAVLGLLMNLLLQPSDTIQDFAVPISGRCLALLSHQDGRIVTGATGVLSRVLPASPSAVEEVVKGGVVKKMLKFLKVAGQLTASYAIKILAVCTKSSRQAQEELVKWDKRFQVLLKLLGSEDEQTVGNAAFCLSQCLLVPRAAASLLGSSVVLLLLRQAGGDARSPSVQQNSAIALGRLCTAEPRHIPQLRKLNGFAVLSSAMKLVHSS
ncbi:TTC12 protein, partial [Dyaphorophyia castanea]|nr:TTC12 protein [Platysteira castanea]